MASSIATRSIQRLGFASASEKPAVGDQPFLDLSSRGCRSALNWYVSRNVRFMFDYLHGNVARQVNSTNFGDAGSKFDAFAMRTQVAF